MANVIRVGMLSEAQAKGIYRGPNRKGRSYEQIFEVCVLSMVAEVYCAQKHDWTMSDRKYEDLVDQDGKIVEIKTFRSIDSMKHPFVRNCVERYETGTHTWCKAHRMIFFRYDKVTNEDNGSTTTVYTFVGIHYIKRNA